MFRLSQFMRRMVSSQPTMPSSPLFRPQDQKNRVPDRDPNRDQEKGPVVVWNLIRRCNLSCQHCYTASADKDFQDELSVNEIFSVLDDLNRCHVPALILSGGEPLLRTDIFKIAAQAKALGFYLGLSSNGTLMDERTVARIAHAGFNYVGVSLDGLQKQHDHMRGQEGAFDHAIAGIRRCIHHGVKVGIRFTPTRENIEDLPKLMALMDREGVNRFYLSHWNYAGRGHANRGEDSAHRATREVLDFLFDLGWQDLQTGRSREIVTGNNDADGPYFLLWIRRNLPEHAKQVEKWLIQWGGNASGVGVANIDNRGFVHPDIFWWHHALGNVRDRSFSEIWHDPSDLLMNGLRQRPRPVRGRCQTCHFLAICGGNTRVRAFQMSGDPWAEDPGCYLTDQEIQSNQ